MDRAEFVEPSAGARRKLLACYLGAALAGALLVFVVRPAVMASLDALPYCARLEYSIILLLGVLIPLPIVATGSIFYARKLLRLGQSPLPGAWVWRRTPVKRGRAVRVQAYGLMAASLLLAFAPLYGWCALHPVVSAVRRQCGA